MKSYKDLNIKKSWIISASAIAFILLIIFLFSSSYSVIIHESGSKYYKASSLMIIRNTMICFKDSKIFNKRKFARSRKMKDTSLFFISMLSIKDIEIIPDLEDEDEDSDAPIRHYGTYKINASGHIGYLYLKYKNNRVYGTIRFPNWAKGTYEKLKNIKIYKKRIIFTRSVSNTQELRRVGASNYFTQQYSGTYSYGGNIIKGQYKTADGKFLWEAERIKK